MAQTVFLNAGIIYVWRSYRSKDPNEVLEVPYANERVLGILTECLKNKDWHVRLEATKWLGSVGANDFIKANNVVALLQDELAKERAGVDEDLIKQKIQKQIQSSLRRLNLNMDYYIGTLRQLQMDRAVPNDLQPKPAPNANDPNAP